jgi:hypothetical protein
MIIDYLHDCKRSLRSCAVVSHAWLPASRFHLFRSIELLPKYERRRTHCCDKLYALIQRSPHIVAIIHELHVLEGNRGKGHHWVNKTPCLALFLNSLTHLNALHLRHIDWIELMPELRGAFRRVFASNPVSNFDFERCDFPFSSLLSILNTCSTSISLTLRSSYVTTSDFRPQLKKMVEDEEAEHGGLERKCRFHDLRIIDCGNPIKSWLNDPESGPDLSHLRTLYCDFNRDSRTLLLRLGEHLHHLRIDAAYGCYRVSIPLSLIVLH